jgi:ABC-type dipeptide/oligopeptide/nickel transport system permease subunit
MPKYSLYSYDDYFCLKPPALLWIGALFLSRAVSLPLAVGIAHFAGVSSDATQVLQRVVSVQTLLPSALAATVLFAMCRRSPQASSAVRWIWSRGRILLAAAAVIDFVLAAYALASTDSADGQSLPTVVTAALDVYLLAYVWFTRRVRDTFADFPLLQSSQ